eukprot:CAMPEP_0176220262 /NCGR_PEP_ID=MMETSP0121_2-20121125/19129_1 /TAXON_ID=160619 /ORGANISM="Kryptoperidinium foliaceum, Strain CCMP 1326" /LENGTH=121 /DNA_ID=CAMNT_0017559441 /DNA_START=71 /DNA_END=436 /DNA_ORIENTATION=+
MAQLASLALIGAWVDGLAIIAGGAYGFVAKGSKISLIASSICGIVLIALAQVRALFCGIWAMLMFAMFARKYMGRQSSEMQQKLLDDPAERQIMQRSKAIMATLTVLSLVEAGVCFAVASK